MHSLSKSLPRLSGYKLLHAGALALARAERQGIRVDVEYIESQRKELTTQIEQHTDEFKQTKFYRHWEKSKGGKALNMDSNFQLAHFLYKVKKLEPTKKTASGGGAVDEEALESLNIPELNILLRVRKLKKLRDTYLESFLRETIDGYMHPFFNLHTVQTFRSSSDSPNFQNIPSRDKEARSIIRKALYPRPGHQLLEIDYGALEVRIAACYHKDPTMVKYIKDKYDMHGDMAKQIFRLDTFDKHDESMNLLRGGAKNSFVFPQFYGDYYGNNAMGLSKWAKLPTNRSYTETDGLILPAPYEMYLGQHLREQGIKSHRTFTEHLRGIENHFWTERFPVYNSWRKKWWRQYQKTGYLDMLSGFRCSGLMDRNSVINYPVQGSAFHCLLWSFIELDRLSIREEWDTKVIGQIHDSILLDTHPDELPHVLETCRRVTCTDLLNEWEWIIVPLDIEAELAPVDGSWYEKDSVKI